MSQKTKIWTSSEYNNYVSLINSIRRTHQISGSVGEYNKSVTQKDYVVAEDLNEIDEELEKTRANAHYITKKYPSKQEIPHVAKGEFINKSTKDSIDSVINKYNNVCYQAPCSCQGYCSCDSRPCSCQNECDYCSCTCTGYTPPCTCTCTTHNPTPPCSCEKPPKPACTCQDWTCKCNGVCTCNSVCRCQGKEDSVPCSCYGPYSSK